MSSRARLILGALALLVALGVGFVFLWYRGPNTEEPTSPASSHEQSGLSLATSPDRRSAPPAPPTVDRPIAATAAPPVAASRPAGKNPSANARQAELLDTIRRARAEESLPPAAAPRDGGAALGAEEIRGAIRALQPKVHECYANRLKEQEGLRGTLIAKFTIVAKDGKGTIDEGEIKSSTLGDLRLETCMLHALTTARFPMPRGQGRVVVSYPFRFLPK